MVSQSTNKSKYRHRRHYSLEFKNKVRQLRRTGLTHREIGRKLGIAYSNTAGWTKGIVMTPKQKVQIQRRKAKRVVTLEYRENLSKKITAYISSHPRFKYLSRDELLNKIKDFYLRHGRIPLKRELNMHRVFKRIFGSWNTAVREAGFEPNPELFAHKFIAKDGHKCDSFTEKVIDDWLFMKGISHKRNFRYADTKMTGDFLIGENKVLEFFGLAGEQKNYDRILKRKRKLAKELNIQLIEVYPKDIYPVNRLAEFL